MRALIDRMHGVFIMKLTVLSVRNINLDGSNETTENQQANWTKHNFREDGDGKYGRSG